MTSAKPPTDQQLEGADSPVFTHGSARDPRVTQPNSPWTMILGSAGLIILAGGVFTSLSHARTSREETATRVVQTTQPIRLAQATPAPAPTGPAMPVYPATQPAATPTATPTPVPPDPYLHAPTMVVDLAEPSSAPGAGGGARVGQAAPGVVGGPEGQLSGDERFAARVTASGGADSARATQMHNLHRVVPQGTMIPAVLETAINSDLPGSVRGVVSRDVRSFDGSQVLIPRGSHLIGQYRSAAAIGQTRAFVIWSRLITPSGISIDIGSPATDPLGQGGLDGKADEHFFRRFGASILLTVLSAGVDAAAANNSGSTNNTLVIGSPTQATNVASIALQKQIDIPTTIKVPPGAPVQVSVARDLDFSGVVLDR